MMIGPSGRTDEIRPLAELIDLPEAGNFDGVGIADAQEDSGALEEKRHGGHSDNFKADQVVALRNGTSGDHCWF